MKKTTAVIALILASVALVKADQIGKVTFTGNFTLNHLYDFNDRGAQPFGTFSDQTVLSSEGIFSPFIQVGAILPRQTLWTAGNHLPLFTIGGFSLLNTLGVGINGPDSGRFVFAEVTLVGNGYVQDPDNTILWSFIAPAYDISNFHEEVTGPITLTFSAVHFVPPVPDTGSTVVLMGVAAGAVFFLHRRIKTV